MCTFACVVRICNTRFNIICSAFISYYKIDHNIIQALATSYRHQYRFATQSLYLFNNYHCQVAPRASHDPRNNGGLQTSAKDENLYIQHTYAAQLKLHYTAFHMRNFSAWRWHLVSTALSPFIFSPVVHALTFQERIDNIAIHCWNSRGS